MTCAEYDDGVDMVVIEADYYIHIKYCNYDMSVTSKKHRTSKGSRKLVTPPLRAGRTYNVGIITGKVLTRYMIYRSH